MKNLIRDQRKSITPFWLSSWMYFLKVKLGGGIVDARGSIAGNTFSRNHYGAYVRARTTPINPNTARQVEVRASVAFLSDMWSSTLTLAQRTAWDLYGSSVSMQDKMGATMYLTGYNHFMRSNIIRKQIGIALISAGPTTFELPAQDPTFAISCSEGTQLVASSFDITMAWALETGGYIVFFFGKPQNAQRNSFGGPWRQFAWVAGVDPGGPASPDSTIAPFAIAEGQHCWEYARILRADGRLSERFRADTFCAV